MRRWCLAIAAYVLGGCSALTGFGDLAFEDSSDMGRGDASADDDGDVDLDSGDARAEPGRDAGDATTRDAEAGAPDARIRDTGPIDCESDDGCNDLSECTMDRCVDGACEFPPVDDGMTCDDENGCTLATTCSAGVCTPSSITTCPTERLGPCDIGMECIPATGECELVRRPVGAACEPPNLCVLAPACNAAGECVGDTTCEMFEDDENECTAVACAIDGCEHIARPGTCASGARTCCNGRCVDISSDAENCGSCGLLCTSGMRCSVGSCSACNGNPDCDDGLSCTVDECRGGNCEHARRDGACLIDGVCRAVGGVNPANQCEQCSASNPTAWTPRDGEPCDDDLFCTQNDRCSPTGICEGEAYLCPSDACNRGVCFETDDVCGLVPRPNGTECDFLSDCCNGDCQLVTMSCGG